MKKLKHIKEYIDPETEPADILFEMANVVQDRTGLPIIIWISPKMANHGPRIKAQNSYSKKVVPDKLFVVTIEDEPRVVGDASEVKKKDVDLVIEFVKINKNILLDFWNEKESDIVKVIESFKRV